MASQSSSSRKSGHGSRSGAPSGSSRGSGFSSGSRASDKSSRPVPGRNQSRNQSFGQSGGQSRSQSLGQSRSASASRNNKSVKDWKRGRRSPEAKKALARKQKKHARRGFSKGKSRARSPYKRLSPVQKGLAEIYSRYKLPKRFPEKVEAAAREIELEAHRAEELQNPLRRDRTDVCCVTVDPADAKDFDDAVFARKRKDGGYFLSVSIADVSHYVTPGSPLDKEAQKRTCSVYLANQVVPMLPFALSDDVCSLVPGKPRLAMTVEIDLSADAEIESIDVFPSTIQSAGRFSYETVLEFLDAQPTNPQLNAQSKNPQLNASVLSILEKGEGLPEKPVEKTKRLEEIANSLLVLTDLAEKRRQRRFAKGSLEFESQELKFIFKDSSDGASNKAANKNGAPKNADPVPIKIEKKASTRATQLVEEAMLLANEAVATKLAHLDLKTAYRVHERPKEENLEAAVPILRELSLVTNEQVEQIVAGNPHAIEDVLHRAKETPYAFLVSTLLLRAQKKAIYAPVNEGHYALQAPAYLHFTSPIRRYPDVIVHRTVKALLGQSMKEKSYVHLINNLDALCATCTEGEKNAAEAERASDDVMMAAFYLPRINQAERGTIVSVTEFGVFVELDETGAQGLLPARLLSKGEAAGDWFAFDEKHLSLVAEKTGLKYEIGQKIGVRIDSVDVAKGYINLDLETK